MHPAPNSINFVAWAAGSGQDWTHNTIARPRRGEVFCQRFNLWAAGAQGIDAQGYQTLDLNNCRLQADDGDAGGQDQLNTTMERFALCGVTHTRLRTAFPRCNGFCRQIIFGQNFRLQIRCDSTSHVRWRRRHRLARFRDAGPAHITMRRSYSTCEM